MTKGGYIYIMTNKWKKVLYIGVTNDLKRRVAEHIVVANNGFTKRYNADRLIYYELLPDFEAAIRREKQLKNWHREWKNNLIATQNPTWRDLSEDIGITKEWLGMVAEAYNIQKIPEQS